MESKAAKALKPGELIIWPDFQDGEIIYTPAQIATVQRLRVFDNREEMRLTSQCGMEPITVSLNHRFRVASHL